MVEDTPVLTARALMEWRSRRAGIGLPRLTEGAILTHQRSLLGRRPPWRSRAPTGLSFETRTAAGVTIACCSGIGAPAAAASVEELAVAGVRRLVLIDIAGSIDASVPSGSAVLVEAAIAGDGTTRHYASEERVEASPGLVEALAATLWNRGCDFATGSVWTTDAVFRETPSQLRAARERGATLVDMETAAVLAAATALGMQAAAVLIAGDQLFDGWRPPGDVSEVQAQLRRVFEASKATLTP